MFIGHIGLAMAAKHVAPKPSLGPPLPSVEVLTWSGLLGWLFLAWAYWIDRHREPVS